jgi:hypothetical protein
MNTTPSGWYLASADNTYHLATDVQRVAGDDSMFGGVWSMVTACRLALLMTTDSAAALSDLPQESTCRRCVTESMRQLSHDVLGPLLGTLSIPERLAVEPTCDSELIQRMLAGMLAVRASLDDIIRNLRPAHGTSARDLLVLDWTSLATVSRRFADHCDAMASGSW